MAKQDLHNFRIKGFRFLVFSGRHFLMSDWASFQVLLRTKYSANREHRLHTPMTSAQPLPPAYVIIWAITSGHITLLVSSILRIAEMVPKNNLSSQECRVKRAKESFHCMRFSCSLQWQDSLQQRVVTLSWPTIFRIFCKFTLVIWFPALFLGCSRCSSVRKLRVWKLHRKFPPQIELWNNVFQFE